MEGRQGAGRGARAGGQRGDPFYETIVSEALKEVENAESQLLAAVRYVQVVRRESNQEVFHDQTGYWMWDAATGILMPSLTIPRAVCVLAGGEFFGTVEAGQSIYLKVRAKLGDQDWGVGQSPFMRG